MRSFWFALKIAALFGVVMIVALAATLRLFGVVAGHGVLKELGMLRAHEGCELAEYVENMLTARPAHDPEVAALIARFGEETGSDVRLETDPDRIRNPNPDRPKHHHRPEQLVTVRGRQCRIIGPPYFETWVPVHSDGAQRAFLVLGGPLHPPEEHHSFFVGVLKIGAITLIGVVGLAFLLASPLRRMSRSMNRIAAGDLEHRVRVRGKDEVATVGASFNAMADRISEIIGGQKELLAAVSHELRSPLTRMKMNLELLRGGGEPNRRIDDLETEISALDAMVNELLVASRLDMKTDQINLSPVDLDACAEQAWERVADAASEYDMVLAVDLAEDARSVSADINLLIRILGNLFENAVRYAGSGQVTLTSRLSGSRVTVYLSDEGPGVDEVALDKLFEPFYRVDSSRSRRTGATGLGLMIVRRAVEAHGGTVGASRNTAGGLTIAFDLPVAGS